MSRVVRDHRLHLLAVPAVGGLVQGDPGSSRSVASKSVRKQKAAGKFGSAEPEREPPSFERALAVEHFGVPLPPAGTSLITGNAPLADVS